MDGDADLAAWRHRCTASLRSTLALSASALSTDEPAVGLLHYGGTLGLAVAAPGGTPS
jgi:hypothetical protein